MHAITEAADFESPLTAGRSSRRHRHRKRSGSHHLACVAAGLVLAILCFLPAVAQSPGAPARPACTATTAPEPLRSRLPLLARGFNLTGWLDNVPARPPDRTALARLRGRGFTHVRLPVTAERVMEALSGRDVVARQLHDLDQALGVLFDLGYAVSLDLHPGSRFGNLHAADPERGFALLEGVWRVLARRYARRRQDRLLFEVLNEPTVRTGIWNAQGPRLAETIRRAAPGHTIVYGSANYQRFDALPDLVPLSDPNVVYAVHFYDPMIFTHQGLDWSEDPLRYLHGIPFPARASDPAVVGLLDGLALQGRDKAATLVKDALKSPWTEERVAAEIGEAAAWGEQNRRPLIINEFGVLRWKAPAADRERWLRTVRSAAERHCIGWAHWDYADAFGLMRRIGDQEIPDDGVLDALLGSRSPATPSR